MLDINHFISLYKKELNPTKYRWKMKRNKDEHSEGVEIIVSNRKTEAQILFLVASRGLESDKYSITVNFDAEHL